MQNLRLKYGDVELPIQDGYEIQKSSGNVSYNDFVCGWEYTLEDLPSKYQEVQIVDIDTNQVKAFGYVDTFDFGEMRETDVERDINISLLSPMTITTIRTAIATGIYNLIELLRNIILAPLISDGFTIETIDIPDHQVTVNFQIETIEYCMSNLAQKFNFWWFIDENKKIYIKDIETMKKEIPKYVYDDNNRIRGLQYIKPITTSDNYANVVNLKNLRTYQYSRFAVSNGVITDKTMPLLKSRTTNIKTGEEVLFQHPIDIKKENIIRCSEIKGGGNKIAFDMNIIYNDNSTDYASIYVSSDDSTYYQTPNISINAENDPKTFDLIRDSFFSNLIVGFRYTGQQTINEIIQLSSTTALVWNQNKFYNNKGIEDKKGKISNTGIVEITVDMKGTWKTKQEVVEIAKNYLYKNDYNFADKLELQTDEDIFSIGDLIKINKFGIDDVYVVTDITEKFSKMDSEYIVKTQKSNNIGNFVDTFRQEPEQEDEGRNYQVYVTHYNNDEIWQTTEVII